MIATEQVRRHLETLGLTHALHVLETRMDAAAKKNLPYAEFLADLLNVEVTARHQAGIAQRHGIRQDFIDPGKPVQNPYIESFNGRMRDEFLDTHWFTSIPQARLGLAVWRRDYNTVRPHSSLNNLTPEEFARRVTA